MEVGERPSHTLLERGVGRRSGIRRGAFRGTLGSASCSASLLRVAAPPSWLHRASDAPRKAPRRIPERWLGLPPSSFRRTSCRFALLAHEPRPERTRRPVLVMRPAAQPEPRDRGSAPARDWLHVIELDQLAALAPAPAVAHERALPSVARPHRALHRRRDVARVGARAGAATRPRGGGELALLELLDQGIEGAVEH